MSRRFVVVAFMTILVIFTFVFNSLSNTTVAGNTTPAGSASDVVKPHRIHKIVSGDVDGTKTSSRIPHVDGQHLDDNSVIITVGGDRDFNSITFNTIEDCSGTVLTANGEIAANTDCQDGYNSISNTIDAKNWCFNTHGCALKDINGDNCTGYVQSTTDNFKVITADGDGGSITIPVDNDTCNANYLNETKKSIFKSHIVNNT